MKIAVDFDGTIVEHEYPSIGREKPLAFKTLKEFKKAGFDLILWTCRFGKELDEAVEFCRDNGIEFYSINRNHPEETPDMMTSRKIDADLYIDDKIIGGFPGWEAILEEFKPSHSEPVNKPSLIERLKRLAGY